MLLQYLLPFIACALHSNAFTIPNTKREGGGPCPKDTKSEFLFGGDDTKAWTSDCPKPKDWALKSDGSCGPLVAGDSRCTSYCEESTAWFYGREVKYDVSPCHADSKCVLAITDTTTITNIYSVNVGIEGLEGALKALSVGVSYSYAVAEARSVGLAQTAADGFCGYWTFLPYYWVSWGTLSGNEQSESWNPMSFTHWNFCKGTVKSEKVYNYKPIIVDGKALGETIFVKTNCQTGKRLCAAYQKPVYAKQAEPLLEDPSKGWRFQDEADCATEAGSDGIKPPSSTSPPVPVPTTVGKACTNNAECGADMICFAGFCEENPWNLDP